MEDRKIGNKKFQVVYCTKMMIVSLILYRFSWILVWLWGA